VLEDKEEGVVAPAGAAVLIRLSWSPDRAKQALPTMLKARLWMNNINNHADLAVEVRNPPPIMVHQTTLTGRPDRIAASELPFKTAVICWSSSRHRLNLQARLDPEGRALESDPWLVGAPVSLSPDECRGLEHEVSIGEDDLGVVCAYRVPITVRPLADDGKTGSDIGPFKRRLLLSLAGEEGEPVEIKLSGLIAGPVTVGYDNNWTIRFNVFDRGKGCTRTTPVVSDIPGLRLEVDTTRTARFLEVQLAPEPANGLGGQARWLLEVHVPPNLVNGPFPRNDAEYRDCAVYLRSRGDKAYSIRVPVEGVASRP
jgi:hypothetical protein